MKKILPYIAYFFILFLYACTNEVDDLFDVPAQQRVNEELKACKQLLTSSENGWRLEYYPSANQSYGGYVMILKFTDKDVTVSSEITASPTKSVTSLYSLKSDMGPTLNFDSYNRILHYFSDPDNKGGAGLGKGYEGDYEFIIQSHSENEIILKGKKTKNIMKMIRMETSGENYLTELLNLRNSITSVQGILGYKGQINGQVISITMPSDRKMSIQVSNNELLNVAYMYTLSGIQFYQPIEIGGKEVTGLDWSKEHTTFTYEGKNLEEVPDPVYPKYLKYLGNYTMTYYFGSTERNIPVKLVNKTYNASNKLYELQGLPFPLQVNYNTEKDCMEILTYTTNNYYVAVWEITGSATLSWSTDLGLIGQLKTGTDNVYEFVDNGVWGSKIARGFILWSASGEYKGFGGDSRFQYIVLTKTKE